MEAASSQARMGAPALSLNQQQQQETAASALPLQSQETEIGQSAMELHQGSSIEELNLVQNLSVDPMMPSQEEEESLPVSGAQPSWPAPTARASFGVPTNSNNPITMRRSLTIAPQASRQNELAEVVDRQDDDQVSAVLQLSTSTVSFNQGAGGQAAAVGGPLNPFGSQLQRQNSAATGSSFLSSIGQRAPDGALQQIQPLFLNPFERSRTDADILEDNDEEEAKDGGQVAQTSAAPVDGDNRTEDENFALMLAGSNSNHETSQNPSTSPLGLQQQRGVEAQVSTTANLSAPGRVGTGHNPVLTRSRSMFDTFASIGPQARPIGLLSGLTNQRVPADARMRRQSSLRSTSQHQAEDPVGDNDSVSSLSIRRVENDSQSLSPSPAARSRYMAVPGLPQPNSRISNSDRLSQASGTPRDDIRRWRQSGNLRGGGRQAPTSPLSNFNPPLLTQDNLQQNSSSTYRQPATPTPSIIRLQPMQVLDSHDSQDNAAASASDANRSMGRVSEGNAFLRGPILRRINNPLPPPPQANLPSGQLSPLVQQQQSRVIVPPLPRLPDQEILAPRPLIRNIISPVPHVELQQTARFAPISLPGRLRGDSAHPHRALTGITNLQQQINRANHVQTAVQRLQRSNSIRLQSSNLSQRHAPLVRGTGGENPFQDPRRQPSSQRRLGILVTDSLDSRIRQQSITRVEENETEVAAAAEATNRAVAGQHERILRLLTGTPINMLADSIGDGLRSHHPFEESQSNSSKSDENSGDGSSELRDLEQDSIMDSDSCVEEKSDVFELESAWSECDQIFRQDLDDLEDELTIQNEQNSANRQININDILQKKKTEQETSRELVKQFGALGVVIYFRSTRYGSQFDHEMLKEFDFLSSNNVLGRGAPIKSIINNFVSKLSKAIEECFSCLTGAKQSPALESLPINFLEQEKTRPSSLKSVKFLDMLNRILPDDMAKLRKVTFEKTLPKVATLQKELEKMTQHAEMDHLGEGRKLRNLVKKVQPYVRDLLVAKLIVDFKIHYHLAMGTTSSCNLKELTRELLPFAIELHSNLQGDLNLAQNHLITKLFSSNSISGVLNTSNQLLSSSMIKESNKLKISSPISGFVVTHKKPEPIVRYYVHLLEKLILASQGGEQFADWTSSKQQRLRRKAQNLSKKRSPGTVDEEVELASKLKERRRVKRLFKQQQLFTML